MSLHEPEIVVGALISPYEIKTKDGIKAITEWDMRAMWSQLRLQQGRSVDAQIKDYVQIRAVERFQQEYKTLPQEKRTELMLDFFTGQVSKAKKPRKLQFIVDDSEVRAVASLKHLLVPPQQVYDMTQLLVEEKHPELVLSDQDGLVGLSYEVPELAHTTFNLGLQIYGGDIFTRKAISLSSWLRVKLCFNPLSWLGSGGLQSFTGNGRDNAERMLRIKVLNELKPRLAQAIDLQLEKTKTLQQRVEVAKHTQVKRSDAEVIMAAMGLSYNLGSSTIEKILDRMQQEDKTLWGMSMASSYVAAHGELKSHNEKSEVVQKLGTISGAAVLLNDIPKVKTKSLEWLNNHIKSGSSKTLDDLAKRLKLQEKKA